MLQPQSGSNESERDGSFIRLVNTAVDVQAPTIAARATGQCWKENHLLVALEIGDLGREAETVEDESHEQNSKSETRNSKQIRKWKSAIHASSNFELWDSH